jgi:hypothetical protein
VKCREFIFLQTSGQLGEARFGMRSAATLHRWMCVKCRSFARNDAVLEGVLGEWRQRLTRADLASGRKDGDSAGG